MSGHHYITIYLSLSSNIRSLGKDDPRLVEKENKDLTNDEVRALWQRISSMWGFSIVRDLIYVGDNVSGITGLEPPTSIQLRISQVDPSSPAQQAGLRAGDVIHQIYGCCTNPPLKLILGMMRDSNAIEMTVMREESTNHQNSAAANCLHDDSYRYLDTSVIETSEIIDIDSKPVTTKEIVEVTDPETEIIRKNSTPDFVHSRCDANVEPSRHITTVSLDPVHTKENVSPINPHPDHNSLTINVTNTSVTADEADHFFDCNEDNSISDEATRKHQSHCAKNIDLVGYSFLDSSQGYQRRVHVDTFIPDERSHTYLLRYGDDTTETVTRNELMDRIKSGSNCSTDMKAWTYKSIVGHRVKRCGEKNVVEVHLKWDSGETTWEPLNMLKLNNSEILVQYARDKKIQHIPGWEWTNGWRHSTDIETNVLTPNVTTTSLVQDCFNRRPTDLISDSHATQMPVIKKTKGKQSDFNEMKANLFAGVPHVALNHTILDVGIPRQTDSDYHPLKINTSLIEKSQAKQSDVREGEASLFSGVPHAVLKQSILDVGTRITSRSARVGLPSKQSSKLKRLFPDSSLFIKRILKFQPPDVVTKVDGSISFYKSAKNNTDSKDLEEIPSNFDNVSEMLKCMAPLLLMEGSAALQQEFLANSASNGCWKREIYCLQLMSCIPVDQKSTKSSSSTVRTYEFGLDTKTGSRFVPNLGELFVLFSNEWEKSRCCLGIVASSQNTFLSDQKCYDDECQLELVQLWVCASDNQYQDTGWLADTELPQRYPDGTFPHYTVHAMNIGTVADIMRQYEGIKAIGSVRPQLQNIILGQSTNMGHTDHGAHDRPVRKPSSVPAHVWDSLIGSLNLCQAAVIETIMSGNSKGTCFLLQGPPGTGKTTTIISLVSALLNGNLPCFGAKAGGTKVQIGGTICGTSNAASESPVSSRILICSPSNQSVDDLAWKLHRFALGVNGSPGAFRLVRFGLLPGEDRHDGRGKKKKATSLSPRNRSRFLESVNLDSIINNIAKGREVKDFAVGEDTNMEGRPSTKRKKGNINATSERQKVLSRCHVVCCTLSGCGSKAFIEAAARDDFPEQEFDVVIIDEACQANEASSLIPFKFNPSLVVLVGDPQQLPVTTLSTKASKLLADRSLFERLQKNNWPVHMLNIQYRMHEEIAQFPSQAFYGDKLVASETVKSREPAVWHQHACFPPYLVWNTVTCHGISKGRTGSYSNDVEAKFISSLLHEFKKWFGHEKKSISIGIITFYNDQVERIESTLRNRSDLKSWFDSGNIQLQISTVDAYQGCETDITILSCVRSQQLSSDSNRKEIGFLKDFRRLNVAITRARYSLWVIGRCETLALNTTWSLLIQNARRRNLIANSSAFDSLCEHAKMSMRLVLGQTTNKRGGQDFDNNQKKWKSQWR